MTPTEIQIGDWVNLSEIDGEVIPCKVVELHTDELIVIQPQDTACDIVGYDMIFPIPITLDILELNGWDGNRAYRKYGSASGVFNNDYNCEIGLDGEGRCFLAFNGWEYSIYEIKGVHQLQQTLRLCGQNELADNFKVE